MNFCVTCINFPQGCPSIFPLNFIPRGCLAEVLRQKWRYIECGRKKVGVVEEKCRIRRSTCQQTPCLLPFRVFLPAVYPLQAAGSIHWTEDALFRRCLYLCSTHSLLPQSAQFPPNTIYHFLWKTSQLVRPCRSQLRGASATWERWVHWCVQSSVDACANPTIRPTTRSVQLHSWVHGVHPCWWSPTRSPTLAQLEYIAIRKAMYLFYTKDARNVWKICM